MTSTTEVTPEATEEETTSSTEYVAPEVPDFDESTLPEYLRPLFEQIKAGIEAINEANVTLLKKEKGKTTADLDKEIQKYDGDLEDLKSQIASFKQMEKQYKEMQKSVRKMYREQVLNEVVEDDVDSDEKELESEARLTREFVVNTINVFRSSAKILDNDDLNKWLDTVQVPQVGRQGKTVVGGKKKPHMWVIVDGVVRGSFGAAASNLENVSSDDLVDAWEKSEGDSFEINSHSVHVVKKTQDNRESYKENSKIEDYPELLNKFGEAPGSDDEDSVSSE